LNERAYRAAPRTATNTPTAPATNKLADAEPAAAPGVPVKFAWIPDGAAVAAADDRFVDVYVRFEEAEVVTVAEATTLVNVMVTVCVDADVT